MNQKDRQLKKINAYAKHMANERGKKEQIEMDKQTKQSRLF